MKSSSRTGRKRVKPLLAYASRLWRWTRSRRWVHKSESHHVFLTPMKKARYRMAATMQLKMVKKKQKVRRKPMKLRTCKWISIKVHLKKISMAKQPYDRRHLPSQAAEVYKKYASNFVSQQVKIGCKSNYSSYILFYKYKQFITYNII